MKLGRITPVDVRTIWTNEASHFTPWLADAENLKLLGEALHLGELTLQTTERSVGDFSADIVAVDEGGVEVLIENQLESSDHRHLGQVLTYLAGLGSEGATVVWVTTRFREEHRAAVDWLNRQTGDGFDFFGVEIEVIRIADSLPAPRFNVVAMPNDWAKQARQAVRRATSDAPSEVGLLYQEYWLGLRQGFEHQVEQDDFQRLGRDTGFRSRSADRAFISQRPYFELSGRSALSSTCTRTICRRNWPTANLRRIGRRLRRLMAARWNGRNCRTVALRASLRTFRAPTSLIERTGSASIAGSSISLSYFGTCSPAE